MNSGGSLSRLQRYRIGNTPLIKRAKLENLYGVPNLLIKDESKNPFGTFKDRRNKLVIEKAMEEHADKLALITSGNSGYSLARLAKGTGLKVVCVVDRAIDPQIKRHLKEYSYEVIEVDLNQKIFHTEDVITPARETMQEVIWDVTNGYHAAFQQIIGEIEKEDPDWLITPLGGGEAYVGLYEGLKRYRMKTKLVGVGLHGLQNNRLRLCDGPSVADKLYTPYTPYKRRIETILKEGHLYIQVSDEQITATYNKIHRGISCEPSSAAAFVALAEADVNKNSKIIVINSGRGVWRRTSITRASSHL